MHSLTSCVRFPHQSDACVIYIVVLYQLTYYDTMIWIRYSVWLVQRSPGFSKYKKEKNIEGMKGLILLTITFLFELLN